MTFISDTGDFGDKIAAELPEAWRKATRGLGTIEVKRGGLPIFVKNEKGKPWSYSGNEAPHAIFFPRFAPDGMVTVAGSTSQDVYALMHEIAHELGCCYGAGTANAHFQGAPVGLMTDPPCTACGFSDRELVAIFGRAH